MKIAHLVDLRIRSRFLKRAPHQITVPVLSAVLLILGGAFMLSSADAQQSATAESRQSTLQHENPYAKQTEMKAKLSEVYARDVVTKKTQLNRLEKLQGEARIAEMGLSPLGDNPSIRETLTKYRTFANEELRLAQAGLGPNHPRMRSVQASQRVLLQQLNEQILSIKSTVKIQEEIIQSGATRPLFLDLSEVERACSPPKTRP